MLLSALWNVILYFGSLLNLLAICVFSTALSSTSFQPFLPNTCIHTVSLYTVSFKRLTVVWWLYDGCTMWHFSPQITFHDDSFWVVFENEKNQRSFRKTLIVLTMYEEMNVKTVYCILLAVHLQAGATNSYKHKWNNFRMSFTESKPVSRNLKSLS